MKELISFLSSYQPLYAGVVQGYPESRIVELEQALGRSLPFVYRDFLTTVGANLGFGLGFDVDLDEVIEMAECRRDTMPKHIYPLALNPQYFMEDWYLDTSNARHEGDGRVVRVGDGDINFEEIRPEDHSFRDLLFSKGYRNVRMLTLPYRESVRWELKDFEDPRSAPRRQELHEILMRSGFHKLAVTSDASALYERGDCAVMVFDSMSFPTFISIIAADSPMSAAIVAETICDQMRGRGIRKRR